MIPSGDLTSLHGLLGSQLRVHSMMGEGTHGSHSVTPGSGTWELPHLSLGTGGQNPVFPMLGLISMYLCAEGDGNPDFLIYDSSICLINQRGPQKGGRLSLILRFALLNPSAC